MPTDLMQEQWNAMAACNPFFSITSWAEFESQEQLDIDFFWQVGALHAGNLLNYLQLGNTQNMDMLEIGCGLGRMTHHFATKFSKVYALDISQVMIERAKTYWEKFANVEFIASNGGDLRPIENGIIDFVFSFYVLNHVVNPDIVINYIRETARVLKPGGLALLHFRIPRDYPLWQKTAWQRLILAVRGIQPKDPHSLWWNAGIERVAKQYTTALPNEFNQFAAWHGCEVAWQEVLKVTEEAQLKIIKTDSALAANTQFVFVTLRRKK